MMDINTLKRRTLLEGYTKKVVDGEEMYLMKLPNTILLSLQTACDLEDGISGLKTSALTKTIIEKFGVKANMDIFNETDTSTIVNNMLMCGDIETQLLYATRFTELVSLKVKDTLKNQDQQVYELFDQEIKSLEQQLNDKDKEIELAHQKEQIAIQREQQANENLSKAKRKSDKQIRVLEHENDKLKKEIEKLRKQINEGVM